MFPAVETAKTLNSNASPAALEQWTVYWVLVVLLLVVETWLSSVRADGRAGFLSWAETAEMCR